MFTKIFFLCLISYLFELFTNLSSRLFNSNRNTKTIFKQKKRFLKHLFLCLLWLKKVSIWYRGYSWQNIYSVKPHSILFRLSWWAVILNAFLKKRPFLQFFALLLNAQENVVNLQPVVLKNVPKSCVLKKLFPAMKPVQDMAIRNTYKSSNFLQKSASARSL